jgi:signal transduction histidine kinase
MKNLIDETIQTVRRIITDIRPSILDDFGLIAAIEWQAQEFQKRTGIECEFISALEDIRLDEQHSTAVFRIFQESLTNVVRHAAATKVTVRLYQEADHLILKVADNGKGITEEKISDPKSLGLLGMRERVLLLGGTVNISGEPCKGTMVSVEIPLDRK